jgi:hypothetical protein
VKMGVDGRGCGTSTGMRDHFRMLLELAEARMRTIRVRIPMRGLLGSASLPATTIHCAIAEPAPRGVRRRRAAQLLVPIDEDRRAEAAGELAVRDHDEAVAAGGLRARICGVLGLPGVPAHADDRAGADDQGPAASPLLEHELALPRRRQRRDTLVEGDGDAGCPGGASGPRHPDDSAALYMLVVAAYRARSSTPRPKTEAAATPTELLI